MILKKFFGKTIKAAKLSAQQMYGDDFVILETSPKKGKNKAGITVMAGKSGARSGEENSAFKRSVNGKHSNGSPANTSEDKSKDKSEDKKDDQESRTNGTPFTSFSPGNGSLNSLYSRANIRNSNPEPSVGEETDHLEIEDKKEAEPEEKLKSSFLTRFIQESDQKDNVKTSPSFQRREQREVMALHKRFDKLESLLDSAFISSNLDYVSHPAFQQLVHTGISTSVVARWFSQIIKQGVDPYDQEETFMNKLSGIIREALTYKSPGEPKKYILFTGPSGSGKTHLIMKLTQHPEFMSSKKTAVLSILPRGDEGTFYYTVLKPYCEEQNIPYYEITSGSEVTELQEKWEEFDHVLIDSPSIGIEQEQSFRKYWKIRQILASLTPLEVHYVVNASLNRFYFRNSSAIHHPLQPDYLAITHLDEVSQWGPIIPFLKEMGCTARYISSGEFIPYSLKEFDPTWFAQKVLQDS